MPRFPVFTTAAPSVPAGSHEMRDDFSNHDPPRSSAYTAPSITPYLGLRSRLSQIWFNRWTILLVLVLARMIIACAGIDDNLTSSRAQALSACSGVETMGSAMASMPHYLSKGVNEMTATGIEKSVNALMQTTTLAVTGVEEIVVFVIEMMIGTYLCLLGLAVNGTFAVVTDAMDNAQKGLNTLTKGLGDDMDQILSTFNTAYDGVRKALSNSVIGFGVKLPDLNVSDDINKLRNLQLPPTLTGDIQKLKGLINLDDARNLTETAIRLPFEKIKSEINGSIGNFTFDRSLFPVPQKEQLTFCSENNGISSFFDQLGNIVSTGRKIFIAVLLVAALLACIPMAYREIRRWRTIRARAQLVGSQEHDPFDVVYIVSRPYTSTAGIKISSPLKSTRRQALVRWVVAYATSDAALFVLTLALAGLFSCLCQYILLKSIEKEVPALSNQVAGFTDLVVSKLNTTSTAWASGTNKAITATNSKINDDMFGWVGEGTTALNDTINVFVDTVERAVNLTFGNTPLRDPIQDVLNCLVLLKAKSIQKGLDWVKENAHINVPLVPNNTFSAGAAASIAADAPPDQSFLASPGDAAADKISNVVVTLVQSYEKALLTETIISLCVLAIYLVVVLAAIIRAASLWYGHEKVRGEGGAAPHVAETHTGNSDFRSDNQDRYGEFAGIQMEPVRRFQIPATQTTANAIPLAPTIRNRETSSNNPPRALNNEVVSDNYENGPAPRYSLAIEEKARHQTVDNPFDDSKRSWSPSDFETDRKH